MVGNSKIFLLRFVPKSILKASHGRTGSEDIAVVGYFCKYNTVPLETFTARVLLTVLTETQIAYKVDLK